MLQGKPNGIYRVVDVVPSVLLDADVATLVTAIAAKIAADPTNMLVGFTQSPQATLLEYWLEDRDRGPFLGKRGNVIRALYTIAQAMRREEVSKSSLMITMMRDDVAAQAQK